MNGGRTGPGTSHGTVDPDDVDRFARLADRWWDPDGPHGPLHRYVPARMRVIRAALAPLASSIDPRRPLAGLSILDIGCGGGLLAEPMTRLGAAVTGVDADAAGIAAAQDHAEAVGLTIAYRAGAAEDLVTEGAKFDAVIASEVVEHVADKPAFCDALTALIRPGGTLILTTLNRTRRSWSQAIVAAEYVLRWVPRGTHDWNAFPTPEELTGLLQARGFTVEPAIGLVYDPIEGSFTESGDARVNYALVATRKD
ncbi:MAG: bifunctional 2-polyprenyl-6-hydroxyphenol methylase/3-demethylubiquinol 3-O-methyltransferase UbiG [Alphaproteobacteria bacterium]|nr:bifunctional 2-polyprenyl-6-hydroxyphenol methylase/3-demethylubiquinol 3-O-methyltransferase UbiG [Alphaproteobacteria bacterium]